jgi:hypothetical protein
VVKNIAERKAKFIPLHSGRNAWLGYLTRLKAKFKCTSIAPEVHRIYSHPTKVSNKKIGRCLHTSLHNFANLCKLLNLKR